jgi:hypothetical protein
MKARKKKIVYRAYKFYGKFYNQDFVNYVSSKSIEPITFNQATEQLFIQKETPMCLSKGNWLIENELPNGKSEFWVVESNIFSKTYKKVGENLYEKKAVTIDCVRFSELSEPGVKEIFKFMGVRPSSEMIRLALYERFIRINTLEGIEFLHLGQVLVKGVHGEFYPVPYEKFIQLYDIVK